MNKIRKNNFSFKKGCKEKIISIFFASIVISSMTGCSKDSLKKKTLLDCNKNGVSLEQLYSDDKNTGLYLIDKIDLSKLSDDIIKEHFQIPIVNTYCNPSTYSAISENPNVNSTDVITLIENNSTLTAEDKRILINGINNLKSSEIDLNYSVLYDNLIDIDIEYFDDLSNNMPLNSNGMYQCIENKLYLPTVEYALKNDKDKDFALNQRERVILHEVLGHASMGHYDKEKSIYCSIGLPIMACDDKGYTIKKLGSFVEEGYAEIIAKYAFDKSKDFKPGYELAVYYVSLINSMFELSINDIYKNDIDVLIQKMREIGIGNSYMNYCLYENNNEYFFYSNHEPLIDGESNSKYVIGILNKLADKYIESGMSYEEVINNITHHIYSYKLYFNPKSKTESGKVAILDSDEYMGMIYLVPDEVLYTCKEYIDLRFENRSR